LAEVTVSLECLKAPGLYGSASSHALASRIPNRLAEMGGEGRPAIGEPAYLPGRSATLSPQPAGLSPCPSTW